MNLDRFHSPQRVSQPAPAERRQWHEPDPDERQDWPLPAILDEAAGRLPPPSRVLP